MKKWILKMLVQKTISFLPYKMKINGLFQKYVTKGVDLNDEHFGYKITHAKDHINYLLEYKGSTAFDCLELGTGWYPIVPIALYLNGANSIHSIDLSAHLTKASIADTIRKYIDWEAQGKVRDFLPQVIDSHWAELEYIHEHIDQLPLSEILDRFKMKLIVGDATKMDFPDNRFDFICSNNTFEHIYPSVLKGILAEFNRVLKKGGGLMSHFIDMSDHFAHYDKSINIYNFLKYSKSQWDLMDNSIQPQNRWRFVDYKNLYKELGISIIKENAWAKEAEKLKTIKVAEMYLSYTQEELAISHGYLVSKK